MSKIALILVEEIHIYWEVGHIFQPYSTFLAVGDVKATFIQLLRCAGVGVVKKQSEKNQGVD